MCALGGSSGLVIMFLSIMPPMVVIYCKLQVVREQDADSYRCCNTNARSAYNGACYDAGVLQASLCLSDVVLPLAHHGSYWITSPTVLNYQTVVSSRPAQLILIAHSG